ncbi:transposable element Tcb2 transposase [Trichonephila clavipes]|uniref:Transposable element Tcb2 transposase n=1 Tax=Trichonephila clavipes TaxID=2585209 RepID=A0A8X6SHA7_TRICX|nr:transposable element Tcb2 transposase [Trichonephila clavipes]
MPGKRARRHFSQLSEFERGLIIGMKTTGWSRHAALLVRWIVRSVPLEIVGSSGHEKVPTCGKLGLERPGSPRGERIEGLCDWEKVVFGDESRFVLGTDDNRVRVWRRPGAIFQQDNARPHTARVAQDFLCHFQTLPWPARSSDFSPVEHVWDQLKRQMPSCHSVHDLELAVQDLGTHLPQGIIRCLINSMPDRVAACIAAGGGPTRY